MMGRSVDGPAPYKDIAASLRSRIVGGELPRRLPTEVMLSRQYGVARNTLRRRCARSRPRVSLP